MTLDLINFVPNTKIKASEVNSNFAQIGEELSLTQGTVEQLNSIVTVGVVPTGSVFYFAGSSVPDGYLLCDGRAVSRSTYATLYTRIGTTYGSGDGTTTFNLPNLKDRYIKGKGDSTSVGATGNAAVGGHTHYYQGTTGGVNANKTGGFNITRAGASDAYGLVKTASHGYGYGEGSNDDYGSGTISMNIEHGHGYSGTTANNAEGVVNEPANIVLLPCIKY